MVTTLGKPSFWLTTFVLPAIMMVFSFGAQWIGTQAFDNQEPLSGEGGGAPAAIGYVDHAGLITTLPQEIPSALVRAFPDEDTARTALEAGELRQYYVIPADYLKSGDLLVIEKDFAPLGNISTVDLFESIINYNLVGNDALASLVADPIAGVESTALEAPETNGGPGNMASYFVSLGVLFIFFFVLTMSSSFMLRSVSQEKENRTVEVLLVSLRPRDLMLGKVLGLGTVALLQMAIWLGGSFLVLERGDSLLAALGAGAFGAIQLPAGFLIWALLYFLLGYLLYSSVLGAIGALAPSARESGQFTFIVMLPLMIPLWLNAAFMEASNGALVTALSLFPLTAPTSMLPRLAAGGVPLWQPIVGLVGLAVTTYAFVLISARFFRADTLLSSASLSWGRLVEEFRKGKA
jgi:ABC-2 type transport system permease protein